MTKTTKIAMIMSANIQAYISILPHHPRPSVMVRRYPILFCAASRPSSFLSNPFVALSKTPFSSSNDVANACEDSLRADAILRRDRVRFSCSVRLCVRRASVVAADMPVLVEAGVRSSARASLVRARSIDCGSSDVEVEGSGIEGSGIGGGG